MGKLVLLPTSTSEITQGNRSDKAHDKFNDHVANGPEQWAYDFGVGKGTKVYAVDSGTVVSVVTSLKGSFQGYGNEITIKSTDASGHTYYTTYAHISAAYFAKDQKVSAGALIATSGDSGSPGVSHLHIQFGTTLTSTNLNSDNHTNPALIADGSHDSASPAYFASLTMHYDRSPNLTDIIYNGMDGTDLFYANNLGDQAYGFGGDDVLRGGTGKDIFDGGDGKDQLFGASGNDTLLGGSGDDTLQGDAGDDILKGGAGADILTGGSGKDSFVWQSTSDFASKADQITDFARGDKIDLSGVDANSNKTGDQVFTYIGSGAFSKHAGELQVVSQSNGNWLVSADTDGNGKADFTIQIHSTDAIVAGDFFF